MVKPFVSTKKHGLRLIYDLTIYNCVEEIYT